jgi:signal transduction histidine kinase
MTARGWFLRVGLGRAALTATLIAAGLAVPLLLTLLAIRTNEGRWSVATVGLVYAGLVGALAGALRLRPTDGSWWRRLGREIAGMAVLVLAVWVGVALVSAVTLALLAPSFGIVLLGDPAMPRNEGPVLLAVTVLILASFVAVGGGVGSVVGRAAALAWSAWDRQRRTRLLWSLTHAQLVVSLTLALGIAGALAIGGFLVILQRDLSNVGANLVGDNLLARVVLFLLPAATALLLVGVATTLVVIPPIALISYLVLRRTTRRVEELAAATGALRAGQFAVRVPVAGEDEVARLQADFNAMAADLERAVGDLRAERDAVARLLAARRALVVAVSHDLRTPVATLRAHLDSALAHWNTGPPPTLRDDLATMAAETERLGRLIDDLFTLSRAELATLPLDARPTDVGALLRRCAAAAGPPAWERGRVEVLAEMPAGLPPALADPDRLEQVVRNLVANAVRHTPPGGLVLLTAAPDDDAVVVQVRDTGEGIAAEDLPRIFERFYRSGPARDRDGGGAGLGLALVKELTEAMGGTVSVESQPGAGSTFTLHLPAA